LTEAPPLAVYVHWPYCARICPYCDFNVVRDRGQPEQGALASAIVRDLEGHAARIGPRRLTSVFLGGGTPSLMDPEWAGRVIAAAGRLWPATGPVEVTLEANPTDAEAGRFGAFAQAGVNRLSLGVQSLDDAALRFLGRNHSAAEARRAASMAGDLFPRLSLDLIYALPGQTADDWRAALNEAIVIGAEHISPYQLTVEAGTPFDRAVKRRTLFPPENDLAADLYETTQAVLTSAGYEAYEVSNHARGSSARSVHNLAYWRGWDYVGVGPGAHGRLSGDAGRLATEAHRRPVDYIAAVESAGVGHASAVILDAPERALERLFLGLRSIEGVTLDELSPLGVNQVRLAEFVDEGLMTWRAGRLAATLKGRVLLDRITADLIP
jgi:putative oxygen-independent coproporphyrinogen III oxidase